MMMDVNSPRAGRLPQRLAAGKHEARAKSRDTSEKVPARWKMIHAASVYSNSFSCGRQCYQKEYFSANCRICGRRRSVLSKGGHHFFGESVYFLFTLGPTSDDELKRYVLHADVLELFQRSDELLRGAFEVLVVLRHRFVREVNRTATTKVRRLWSTQLGGNLLHFGVLGSQLLRSNLHVIRKPGIRVFGCTLYCGFAFSTRPDWEARFLNRRWADGHRGEIVILPVETGTLRLP